MKKLVSVVLVIFTIFTSWAIAQTGLAGFFRALFDGPAGWQVLADLTIALTLVLGWMARDARRHGRAFLPYLVLTLGAGSIGPLLYLLLAPRGERERT